jgi:dolichol-phosphate mannosyltransferase
MENSVRPEISVIVPVFNEAENVLPLWAEVSAALGATGRSYELVFVDDGSTDATWERIQQARQQDARVRGLKHACNAGQSAAVWTGLQATTGPIVATLDGDRQDDPAELPRMLGLLGEADFVSGMRLQRQDNWLRRVSTRVARWARRVALGADFRDTGCALRVFRREVLTGVLAFNGWHRFLPILVAGRGYRLREIPVNHRPRVAGVSKYGVWNRFWRGLVDLFGVAWVQKRRLKPVAYSELPQGPADPGPKRAE